MRGGKTEPLIELFEISRLPSQVQPRLQCVETKESRSSACQAPSAPMIKTRNAWVSIREQLVNLVTVDADQKCLLEGSSRYRSQMGCLDLRHDLVTVCFLRFPSGD
jgi:hypothetical protein